MVHLPNGTKVKVLDRPYCEYVTLTCSGWRSSDRPPLEPFWPQETPHLWGRQDEVHLKWTYRLKSPSVLPDAPSDVPRPGPRWPFLLGPYPPSHTIVKYLFRYHLLRLLWHNHPLGRQKGSVTYFTPESSVLSDDTVKSWHTGTVSVNWRDSVHRKIHFTSMYIMSGRSSNVPIRYCLLLTIMKRVVEDLSVIHHQWLTSQYWKIVYVEGLPTPPPSFRLPVDSLFSCLFLMWILLSWYELTT